MKKKKVLQGIAIVSAIAAMGAIVPKTDANAMNGLVSRFRSVATSLTSGIRGVVSSTGVNGPTVSTPGTRGGLKLNSLDISGQSGLGVKISSSSSSTGSSYGAHTGLKYLKRSPSNTPASYANKNYSTNNTGSATTSATVTTFNILTHSPNDTPLMTGLKNVVNDVTKSQAARQGIHLQINNGTR